MAPRQLVVPRPPMLSRPQARGLSALGVHWPVGICANVRNNSAGASCTIWCVVWMRFNSRDDFAAPQRKNCATPPRNRRQQHSKKKEPTPPSRSFRLQHQLKEPEVVADEAVPSDGQRRRQGQTTYEQRFAGAFLIHTKQEDFAKWRDLFDKLTEQSSSKVGDHALAVHGKSL